MNLSGAQKEMVVREKERTWPDFFQRLKTLRSTVLVITFILIINYGVNERIGFEYPFINFLGICLVFGYLGAAAYESFKSPLSRAQKGPFTLSMDIVMIPIVLASIIYGAFFTGIAFFLSILIVVVFGAIFLKMLIQFRQFDKTQENYYSERWNKAANYSSLEEMKSA